MPSSHTDRWESAQLPPPPLPTQTTASSPDCSVSASPSDHCGPTGFCLLCPTPCLLHTHSTRVRPLCCEQSPEQAPRARLSLLSFTLPSPHLIPARSHAGPEVSMRTGVWSSAVLFLVPDSPASLPPACGSTESMGTTVGC